jgi:hypothetical protein
MRVLVPSRAAGEIAKSDRGHKEKAGCDSLVGIHNEYSDGTACVMASQSGGLVPSMVVN